MLVRTTSRYPAGNQTPRYATSNASPQDPPPSTSAWLLASPYSCLCCQGPPRRRRPHQVTHSILATNATTQPYLPLPASPPPFLPHAPAPHRNPRDPYPYPYQPLLSLTDYLFVLVPAFSLARSLASSLVATPMISLSSSSSLSPSTQPVKLRLINRLRGGSSGLCAADEAGEVTAQTR